jgi:hypothetical protein
MGESTLALQTVAQVSVLLEIIHSPKILVVVEAQSTI